MAECLVMLNLTTSHGEAGGAASHAAYFTQTLPIKALYSHIGHSAKLTRILYMHSWSLVLKALLLDVGVENRIVEQFIGPRCEPRAKATRPSPSCGGARGTVSGTSSHFNRR